MFPLGKQLCKNRKRVFFNYKKCCFFRVYAEGLRNREIKLKNGC